MLCFSFEQVETKKYQKPSLRDINHAGVLVVYGWCTWGGGGAGTPLNGLFRDMSLDRVWCFTFHPDLRGVLSCL